MKKQTIALALALTMAGTLAACGTEKNPGSSGANNGSTTSGAASGSGTGSAGQVTRRYNTAMNQGRDYFYGSSYMDDGRYTAGSNGQVYGSKNDSLSQDLTQGARDIVRGTENAIEDIGEGIGNVARDVTGMGNGAYSGTPSWEPDSSARY